MGKTERFELGDPVETLVSLPGIPAGAKGRVKEIGPLFLAVELEDRRIGYYSPRQLQRRNVSPPQAD